MNVTVDTIRSSFRDLWTIEQAQRAVNSRSRCSLCPSFLNDPGAGFIKVEDRGAEQPTLLFVGEAPGKDEAREGKSFIGTAARHFDTLLKQVGVDLDQCRWANVVKCLHESTRVRLADGTARTVGDLVRAKYTGEVLSFDSGKIVTARIVGHHVSPLAGRRWLKVSYVGAKATSGGTTGSIVTNDHQFLTCDGDWVRADRLDGRRIWVGDVGFGPRASEVLLGTLLGDATIGDGTACLQVVHGADQEEWAQLKASILGAWCASSHPDQHGYARVRFHTRASRQIAQLRGQFYGPEGKQVAAPLTGFGVQAAATLFMDDGCMRVYEGRRPSAQIATCAFNQDSCDQIVAAFKQLGLSCYARTNGDSPHLRIFFTADETPHLVALIDRFVPPSMEYKLGGLRKHAFDPSLWEYEGQFPISGEAVVEEAPAYYSRSKTAYCLSIEGTQNFLTSAGVAHNCFPHEPGADKSRSPAPDEIMRCSPYLFDTIADLQPAVIMSIGAIASAALLGKDTVGTISQVSGKIFKTTIRGREYTVVPCYHPSADLQSGGRYTDKIIKAAAIAWGLVNRTEIPVTAHMLNSTQECIDYLDSLLRRYRAGEIPWVAYDLEWGSQMEAVGSKRSEAERAADMALYDPEVDINIASFATSIDEGYSLVLDHVESNVDVARVKAKLREVFAEVPVVAHNAIQAEVPWTKTRIGIELIVAHDTMFGSYSYWMKTASHGLKPLCFRLFQWPDWGAEPDAWFNSQPDPKKRTYRYLPLDIMRKYAPVDACGCWGAIERLLPMIAEAGVQQNYNRRMALANVVAKWHERGNIVDLQELERLKQVYPGKVEAVLKRLRAVPEIQEYEKLTGNEFNPGSAPQKGEVLYGVLGAPIGEMNPKIQRRRGAPSPEVRVPVDLPKGSKEIPYPIAVGSEAVWLGPLSGQKGSERLDIDLKATKELHHGVVLRKPTKFDHRSPLILVHGTPKTDEEQLLKIEREAVCPTCRGDKVIPDNRAGGMRTCIVCDGSGYRPEWETLGRVAYDIHLFMKVRLIISNYLEKFPYFIRPGTNQLFTNYGLHTVATGRLSTMNPNLQSFPWNSDIKRLFVSKFYDEGGLYMGADYSQLEVRVLAAVSEDPLLIAAYLTCKKCGRVGNQTDRGRCPTCNVRLGIDLHRRTASMIAKVPEDAVTDAQRTIAKAVTFGVIYGRGARAIADETGLSVSDADGIIKGFFTQYKKVSEYVRDMHATCIEKGEALSKTGTRLIFEHRADVLEAVRLQAEAKVKIAEAYKRGERPTWRLPAYLDMRLAEAQRQSQNYPIQGPGGEICIDAIIMLDEIFTQRGMKSHHWETVHDSIGFDLYPSTDEILTTMWLAREVMENRVADKHPWMTVPLGVDRVLGARWDGDVEVEDVDGDQIKVKGPKEYYEQICGQLEKAGILAKTEIIEEKQGKPAPEITQKGYAGGSGRTEKVEAVIRLAV